MVGRYSVQLMFSERSAALSCWRKSRMSARFGASSRPCSSVGSRGRSGISSTSTGWFSPRRMPNASWLR
jgi:hypothetical protein